VAGVFHRRQLQMIARWRTLVFLPSKYPRGCSPAVRTLLAPFAWQLCPLRILRRGGLSSLHQCRPSSDIHRRPAGTAHRVPTPMNRSRRHTPRGTPHENPQSQGHGTLVRVYGTNSRRPECLLPCHVPAYSEEHTSENRKFPCAGPIRLSDPYSPHIDPRTASTVRVASVRLRLRPLRASRRRPLLHKHRFV
jgi:hypothetical protein